MGYASVAPLEHINCSGIRQGLCSLLVDPCERVPCPTLSEGANMTTLEKTENLEHVASLRRMTISTESRTPKIWYQMLIKRGTGKEICGAAKGFFQPSFQPIRPRREQQQNRWLVGPGSAIEWLCVSTDLSNSMSEYRAKEIFTIATIFINKPKTEISKHRRDRKKPTSPVHPAHFFGG